MAWLIVFLSLLYGIPIAAFAVGHFRAMRRFAGSCDSVSGASVVIAARNEERGIESCLRSVLGQNLISEIIVVDDHSTDHTAEIVERLILEGDQRLTLIQSEAEEGKKAAIHLGVKYSQSEIVLLTDADCILPENWAEKMMGCFEENTGFVVGPVAFRGSEGWAAQMMSLEWLGFMGIAAGAVGLGNPILCSGANLAFRRSVFEEVDGYVGMERFSSGDDELLMQKIADDTTWDVGYCPSFDAIVETAPPASIAEFLAQRRRWASKGAFYKRKWLVAMNIGFWLFFLSIPLAGAASVWLPALRWPLVVAMAVKLIPELLLLAQSARFYESRHLLRAFLFSQPFQIAYILWAGVAGMRGDLVWKSRNLAR